MNIQEFRQLREDLEYADRLVGGPENHGGMSRIIAAARQTLDRWQECDNPDCEDGEVITTNNNGDCRFSQACPRCGGSGVLPNQERLEQAQSIVMDTPTKDIAEAAVRAFDKEPDHDQDPRLKELGIE